MFAEVRAALNAASKRLSWERPGYVGVLQVAFHDGQETPNFITTGRFGLQPTVLGPFF